MIQRLKLFVLLLVLGTQAVLSQTKTVTGVVRDDSGEPLPGVTVLIVGTSSGVITDLEGSYSIEARPEDQIQFRFVGMQEQTFEVGDQTVINVTLQQAVTEMDEVVVVGYGIQKKESVVGAISQTTGDEIKRSAGGTDLANSITGLMPGVITIRTSGLPGGGGEDDDPTQIYIRGQTTWNGGQPLILVDGIERKMSDIDPNEVSSISVLKDASATAVFGVKGANGVILITTRRGKVGKPKLSFESRVTASTISRLPKVLNSYKANYIKDLAIENEVPANESSWGSYVPHQILDYYRTQQYPELYPDVDWVDEMTKDVAWSQRHNMNVSGGTEFVKYFLSLGYLHEGDILRTQDFGQGYEPSFQYDRYNFRSNLDFSLTETTSLGVNLSGYYGQQQRPTSSRKFDYWKGVYQPVPDLFPVRYSDGTWANYSGYDRHENPVMLMNVLGLKNENRAEINTDFNLRQKLDFITKGLEFGAKIAYDNRFNTEGPNINDDGVLQLYKDPRILNAEPGADTSKYYIYQYPTSFENESHGYNFVDVPLGINDESIQNNIYRSLYYEFSLNYARTFGKNEVTGLFLMNRRESATGSNFTNYREDWVGRVTYNYDTRYFLDINGAYNGSEKFDRKYRFGFFPSVGTGWTISNEEFFKTAVPWMNQLKIRYSWGQVGNDGGIDRWQYVSGWGLSNQTWSFGSPFLQNSYPWYTEQSVANPDLHWETAEKQNIGIEAGFFNNMIAFDLDIFWEHRYEMFIDKEDRLTNVIFGKNLPAANIGELDSKGWELEVRFSKVTPRLFHYWANLHWARAKDIVVFREDPELAPEYQKREGFPIGQNRSHVESGIIQSWDELYTGVLGQDNTYALPGDYRLIDFNADGVVDNKDGVPWGYPSRPEYNYGLTGGFDYKGFSFMFQFYGVYNVTDGRSYGEFPEEYSIVYDMQWEDSWSPEFGRSGDDLYRHVRFNTGSSAGTYWQWDRSYLKLQNVEVGYTFENPTLKTAGISNLRVFFNGNNLWTRSNMPEDRDRDGGVRAYPLLKRYSLGMNVSF